MKSSEGNKGVQKQLRWLLCVLVLITATNAFVFWRTLNNLIVSYKAAARGQKIVSQAGDLERSFFEENKLRGIQNSQIDETDEGTSFDQSHLSELRHQIRTQLKELRANFTDKTTIEEVKQIEKRWRGAHDEQSTRNLLRATKNLVSNQEKILKPLEVEADEATHAVMLFLLVYLVIFLFTIIIIAQFMKRRVLRPLSRLSEKMENFQAGHHELPPQSQNDDEISNLEAQFYYMASRIGDTVTDLKELDRVKTDFISVASHELRTPMTAVKGSLSLILSGSLPDIDPDVKELLSIAEKETDRLIRLINDILDLTKMEAKQLPLDRKWNDLGTVIKEAVEGINGLLEVTKVSAIVVESHHPVKAFMDRDRIQQVVTNLLSNAVKFSPEQSEVTLTYGPYPTSNGKGAIVKIIDAGPGIKDEDQHHLFEKFRSTDSGRSKTIKGTGLGLPICKALVEQHGGQIGVQSKFGQGSTFYFIIPEPVLSQNTLPDSDLKDVA